MDRISIIQVKPIFSRPCHINIFSYQESGIHLFLQEISNTAHCLVKIKTGRWNLVFVELLKIRVLFVRHRVKLHVP